jgi:hypothetical protein
MPPKSPVSLLFAETSSHPAKLDWIESGQILPLIAKGRFPCWSFHPRFLSDRGVSRVVFH